MADVFSKAKRSLVMSSIRSSGKRDTEMKLVTIFKRGGIVGWRRNVRLPGKPDFVFRQERLTVVVDGCFWHGCRRHCRRPKSNTAFWFSKIERNISRDREVNRLLKRAGWRILRIWEHALNRPDAIVRGVRRKLLAQQESCPPSSPAVHSVTS